MKKKKRAEAYIKKKFGSQAKGIKPSGNEINPLAEFGNVKSIRASQSAQLALYQSNDLEKMEYFFSHSGCFESETQRQMIKDDNLEVLKLFLRHWEFTPLLRAYMIKQGSLEFVKTYIRTKTLGKQYEDLISCGRFSKGFWREIYSYLPADVQKKAEAVGRIKFE